MTSKLARPGAGSICSRRAWTAGKITEFGAAVSPSHSNTVQTQLALGSRKCRGNRQRGQWRGGPVRKHQLKRYFGGSQRLTVIRPVLSPRKPCRLPVGGAEEVIPSRDA